jgi:hypothetical protein
MPTTLRAGLLWAVFLTASGVTAYDWSFRAGDLTKQYRLDHHRAIVDRTALAPDRYRVLVPYTLDVPIRALEPVFGYKETFGRVYALFYWLSIAGSLYMLHRYLAEYFTSDQAMVGALVAASTMPMALRYYDYSPYSLLEPILVAYGLLLIRRGDHAALAWLVAIATLNRETAIFLVFYFVSVMPLDATHGRLAARYLLIWVAVYGAIRVYAGSAWRYFDLPTIWHGNTHSVEQMAIAATSWALLLGAFWIFAALGYRRAPWFVRRTALVAPIYLLTVLVWGTWVEVRLLVPLYPVVFPLALAYLFEPRNDKPQLPGT